MIKRCFDFTVNQPIEQNTHGSEILKIEKIYPEIAYNILCGVLALWKLRPSHFRVDEPGYGMYSAE